MASERSKSGTLSVSRFLLLPLLLPPLLQRHGQRLQCVCQCCGYRRSHSCNHTRNHRDWSRVRLSCHVAPCRGVLERVLTVHHVRVVSTATVWHTAMGGYV